MPSATPLVAQTVLDTTVQSHSAEGTVSALKVEAKKFPPCKVFPAGDSFALVQIDKQDIVLEEEALPQVILGLRMALAVLKEEDFRDDLRIVVPFRKSEDRTISCVVCGQSGTATGKASVDYELEIGTRSGMTWVGLHEECRARAEMPSRVQDEQTPCSLCDSPLGSKEPITRIHTACFEEVTTEKDSPLWQRLETIGMTVAEVHDSIENAEVNYDPNNPERPVPGLSDAKERLRLGEVVIIRNCEITGLKEDLRQAREEIGRLRDIIEGIRGDVNGRGESALMIEGMGFPMSPEDTLKVQLRLRAAIGPNHKMAGDTMPNDDKKSTYQATRVPKSEVLERLGTPEERQARIERYEERMNRQATRVPMSEVYEELGDPSTWESETENFHAEVRQRPRPALVGMGTPGSVLLLWDPPINKGTVGMHFASDAEANDWYCSNLAPMEGWPIFARLVPEEGFVAPEGLFSFVDQFK